MAKGSSSTGTVRAGDDFEQVTIGILEVHSASAVVIVDPAASMPAGVGPVIKLGSGFHRPARVSFSFIAIAERAATESGDRRREEGDPRFVRYFRTRVCPFCSEQVDSVRPEPVEGLNQSFLTDSTGFRPPVRIRTPSFPGPTGAAERCGSGVESARSRFADCFGKALLPV